MTAITDDTLTPDAVAPADDTPNVHDQMAAARLAGYSWDDIHGHLDQATDTALAAGYTQPEIDAHLGYKDPAPLTSRLTNAALERTVQAPDADPFETATHGFDPETLGVPPELRQSYANALQSGEATSPEDFGKSWQDAVYNVTADPNAAAHAQALAGQLPSNEDFTDHAIAAVHESGQEPSVPLVRITKDNLVEHYADTGEPPRVALQRAQADPNFADAITSPQPETPWQKIENAVAGLGSWLIPPLDKTTADMTGKAFESAFENLGGDRKEYFDGIVGDLIHGGAAAIHAPFALLQGTLMGVVASTVGTVGGAVHMTEGEKDRTLRDALALVQSFGADAPNIAEIGKAPSIADTFEHITTGVHPEASRLIAEHAPDIIQPVEVATAPKPPEKIAGAAVKDGDQIYVGQTHADALEKMSRLTGEPIDSIFDRDFSKEGFVTSEGRYVSRAEAAEIAAAQDQIEPIGAMTRAESGELVRGTGELLSEQLDNFGKLDPYKISTKTPEQIAGELSGRVLTDKFTGWMRDLLADESGSIDVNKWFTRWDTPKEFAERIRTQALRAQAKADIQQLTGTSYRENQVGWKQLEEHFKTVEKLVPEYKEELTGIKAAGSDVLNRYDPFTGQMRDRSTLGQLDDWMDRRFVGDEPAPNHPLFPAFTALRQGAGIMRAEIEKRGPEAVQNFIEHYLARQYKDPERFSSDVVGKQGSMANTQRRSIPTHTEAIERGHDPLYYNPLERQLHYNQAMRAFLDQDNMIKKGLDSDAAYYDTQPRSKNDIPLDGRGSRRNIDIGMTQAQAKQAIATADNMAIPYGATIEQIQELANNGVISQRLFANRGWGSVYNRYYSLGFGKYGPGARTLYEKALFASNASVAAKLGLSLYHFGDIIQESYSTAISRALGAAFNKDPSWQMLGDLVGAPVTYYRRGKMAQDIYLRSPSEREWANMNNGAGASYEEKMARTMAGSGVRPVGRTQEYMVGQATNLWSAIARGTYRRELREGVAHITENTEDMPALRKGAVVGGRAAGFAVSEAGRVLNAAMTPLFDKFVPRVKYGAAVSEMSDWFRRNPGASEESALAYARKLNASMDDRFGELVQDNLHWNKTLRQALNVMTVSVGWEFGTLRAFGNVLNARDAERRALSARWLAGFMGATAVMNSVYQYLMTGHGPSSLKDAAFPRTGGTTPEGAPQRALLPGYQKDPAQWWIHLSDARDPVQFANGIRTLMGNKANNFIGLLTHWMDSPDLAHYFAKVKDDYKPINLDPIKNVILGGHRGQLRGDNIPNIQQALGLARPAPPAIEDPERAAKQKKQQQLRAQQTEDAIERSHNRRLEEPDPEVESRTSDELKDIAAQLRELLGGSVGSGGRTSSGGGAAPRSSGGGGGRAPRAAPASYDTGSSFTSDYTPAQPTYSSGGQGSTQNGIVARGGGARVNNTRPRSVAQRRAFAIRARIARRG